MGGGHQEGTREDRIRPWHLALPDPPLGAARASFAPLLAGFLARCATAISSILLTSSGSLPKRLT
jgi:hypothetical protein